MSWMRTFVRRGALWIMVLGLWAPAYAVAQVSDTYEADAREITRDATALRADLRVDDRDLVDTALVFTNAGDARAIVLCRAFDADGERVGRIRLKVPAGGLRYALASDLSLGRDFVGRVQCSARSRVLASAVLLAPMAMTDLDVHQHQGIGSILFPVVATY